MRQVFSSARLENVEAVAQLLRDHGVEVRISNGRSYRSAIRGNFSYRDTDSAGPTPAVWVLRADQQPLARQVLRDGGLLQSGRTRDDSFLPPNLRFAEPDITVAEKRQRNRLRYTLLAAIAALAGLVLVSTRPQRVDAPVASTPAAPSAPNPGSPLIAASTQYRVATPPALAEHLFARALATSAAGAACLSIDDADPPADLVARLARRAATVRPASQCTDDPDATTVQVVDYRTDGSGRGTVELRTTSPGANTPRPERLPVARDGDQWRVLDRN